MYPTAVFYHLFITEATIIYTFNVLQEKVIMKQLNTYALFAICMTGLVFFACNKDDDDNTPAPTVVKSWTVALSPRYEVTVPAGRTETGSAELQLYSDNTLNYHIMLGSLAAGDALTASHIHIGDPVSNGPIVLPFPGTFANNMLTGTTTIRASLADSLKTLPMYVNVHSSLFPAGLMRGQMDKTIVMAANTALTGAQETIPVVTTATGTGIVRVTSDSTIYVKVNASGIEATDAFTVSHIHKAAAGANGPIIVNIYANFAAFGTVVTNKLDGATFNSMLNDPIYFNVHSTVKPGGIIRGQIR